MNICLIKKNFYLCLPCIGYAIMLGILCDYSVLFAWIIWFISCLLPSEFRAQNLLHSVFEIELYVMLNAFMIDSHYLFSAIWEVRNLTFAS